VEHEGVAAEVAARMQVARMQVAEVSLHDHVQDLVVLNRDALEAVGLNKSKANRPSVDEAVVYDDFLDRLLSTCCTEGLIGLSVR